MRLKLDIIPLLLPGVYKALNQKTLNYEIETYRCLELHDSS